MVRQGKAVSLFLPFTILFVACVGCGERAEHRMLAGMPILGEWELVEFEIRKPGAEESPQREQGLHLRIYSDHTVFRAGSGDTFLPDMPTTPVPGRLESRSDGDWRIVFPFDPEMNLLVRQVSQDALHLTPADLNLRDRVKLVFARSDTAVSRDSDEQRKVDLLFAALLYAGRQKNGFPPTLATMLDEEADVNGRFLGRGGLTPVEFEAVLHGRRDVIQRLLDAGASLEGGNRGALYLCMERSPHLAPWLLEQGMSPNGVPRGGLPLEAAVEHGRPDVVNQLLAAGADVRRAASDGESAVAKLLSDRTLQFALFGVRLDGVVSAPTPPSQRETRMPLNGGSALRDERLKKEIADLYVPLPDALDLVNIDPTAKKEIKEIVRRMASRRGRIRLSPAESDRLLCLHLLLDYGSSLKVAHYIDSKEAVQLTFKAVRGIVNQSLRDYQSQGDIRAAILAIRTARLASGQEPGRLDAYDQGRRTLRNDVQVWVDHIRAEEVNARDPEDAQTRNELKMEIEKWDRACET